MVTSATLRATVLGLPPDERAELAHDLIASLDGDETNPDADALWAAEIEKRAQAVLAGEVELIDATAVHTDIASRLRARGAK